MTSNKGNEFNKFHTAILSYGAASCHRSDRKCLQIKRHHVPSAMEYKQRHVAQTSRVHSRDCVLNSGQPWKQIPWTASFICRDVCSLEGTQRFPLSTLRISASEIILVLLYDLTHSLTLKYCLRGETEGVALEERRKEVNPRNVGARKEQSSSDKHFRLCHWYIDSVLLTIGSP